MQAELAYYGKVTEFSYLDSIPWSHFVYLYRWLCDVKKEEQQHQERAKKEQASAVASSRASKPHIPRRR
jgi:hypothetical protein